MPEAINNLYNDSYIVQTHRKDFLDLILTGISLSIDIILVVVVRNFDVIQQKKNATYACMEWASALQFNDFSVEKILGDNYFHSQLINCMNLSTKYNKTEAIYVSLESNTIFPINLSFSIDKLSLVVTTNNNENPKKCLARYIDVKSISEIEKNKDIKCDAFFDLYTFSGNTKLDFVLSYKNIIDVPNRLISENELSNDCLMRLNGEKEPEFKFNVKIEGQLTDNDKELLRKPFGFELVIFGTSKENGKLVITRTSYKKRDLKSN